MAEDHESEEKPSAFFDRYEVVAIALPGAAFLLFLAFVRPHMFGPVPFEAKTISLGTLGIFAIASMIAGQLLLGFVNAVEIGLNAIGDRTRPSPIKFMPEHERNRIYKFLKSRGVHEPESASRLRFRSEMYGTILNANRRNKTSRFSDVYNVTYGLNRGLAMASVLAALLALNDKDWIPAVILLAICASTSFRAARANRRFERDMLRTFANHDESR